MDIALVSCVSAKLPRAAQARALYQSAWFLKARRYVEGRYERWHILSAEHGLIAPQQIVAPYERTLNTMPRNERVAWARKVWAQLQAVLAPNATLWIFAGQRYREGLCPIFDAHQIPWRVPMEGLGIGQQLAWLDRQSSPALQQEPLL